MASMTPSHERRMHMRYATPQYDGPGGAHTALSMFMLVVLVMLVVGAAYFYASYLFETQHYDILLPVAASDASLSA